MRTQVIEIHQALGKLLCSAVFQGSGKKLLAKGHVLSEEDIRLLSAEGYDSVPVAVLEAGEVPEEEAAARIAAEAACGSMEIRMAAGGRANLFCTENSCLLVDEDLLREFNRSGYVTIATVPNFSYAAAGQRVATVKTAPFAIPEEKFRAALALARERGPVLQARPIRNPAVGVLYSDPRQAQRGRALFEGIMRTRLERLGTAAAYVLATLEEEERLARSLEHMLRARPSLVLIASTTAPAGPDDVVGRAIARVGCRLECFLAPVEPGNLLLLSYAGKVPVVSAPGCFRSPKPNVVDLVLPPLLAWYPLTAVEISELGHGGLLQ